MSTLFDCIYIWRDLSERRIFNWVKSSTILDFSALPTLARTVDYKYEK